MLELLICSILTILPDYLFRRYRQGLRIGTDINLFTLWYVLRYGITGCLILTVSLITVIFYHHPKSDNVTSFFRTISILPEGRGRVTEVLVGNDSVVQAGDVIFKMDSATQEAQLVSAQSKLLEIEASKAVAEANIKVAEGGVLQAENALLQTQEELKLQEDLLARGSNAVSPREVERLQIRVQEREGGVAAAEANLLAAQAVLNTQIPAQLDSAQASVDQAQVALNKMTVIASVSGVVKQFALQPGDLVSPIGRVAGILVPTDLSNSTMNAGFDQLAKPLLVEGMAVEVSCLSRPFTVFPMKITAVTEYIAAGQFRPSDQLIDIQQRAQPGTVGVTLEPMFEGTRYEVPAGSKCFAAAYTDNHHKLEDPNIGTLQKIGLHVIDTTAILPAAGLRLKALIGPVQQLVLHGH